LFFSSFSGGGGGVEVDDAGSIGGDVVDGSVVVCFAESNNRLAQVSNEVCCVGCGMVDTMEWLTATIMAPMRSFTNIFVFLN
jgi:hypothetical protein